MDLTRDNLRAATRIGYVLVLVLVVRLFVVYSIPWWEILAPLCVMFAILNMLRLYSLTDGMVHNELKKHLRKFRENDIITDKVLNHTQKKSNKRYKFKKKRPRRAR